MKIVAWILAAWLALFAIAAHSVEARSERVDRSTHDAKRAEEFRDRDTHPERLPPELKRSWLAKQEGKDPNTGEEMGHTLRRHVPDAPTRESIEDHVRARDADMMRKSPDGKKPDLSMYADVKTAEKAIDRTMKEEANKKEIERWMADKSNNRNLELYGESDRAVGIHYARGGDGKGLIDLQEGKDVKSNVVVLRKDSKGGYFIRTSFPVTERAKTTEADND